MKPYDTELSKKEEVRAMFDNIAPAYDRLNHTLSLSVDRIWRRRVVRIVGRLHPRRVLDMATGTGDLAVMMARSRRPISRASTCRRGCSTWRAARSPRGDWKSA